MIHAASAKQHRALCASLAGASDHLIQKFLGFAILLLQVQNFGEVIQAALHQARAGDPRLPTIEFERLRIIPGGAVQVSQPIQNFRHQAERFGNIRMAIAKSLPAQRQGVCLHTQCSWQISDL